MAPGALTLADHVGCGCPSETEYVSTEPQPSVDSSFMQLYRWRLVKDPTLYLVYDSCHRLGTVYRIRENGSRNVARIEPAAYNL